MQKKSILLLLLITMMGCQTNNTSTAPLSDAAKADDCSPDCSSIVAQRAIKEMGQGFNLGQMFESDQHSRTFAAAKPKIDAYYAKGFRNVRIPVTWTETIGGQALANPDTGVINQNLPRFKEITAVIDYALSKPGMYVILNAHHEKGIKEYSKSDVLAQLWNDITEIYQDRSYRLIFQLLNEPHLENRDPMVPEDLRHMSELSYNNIRELDEERIVVIGGNQWFGAHEMMKTWPNIDQVGGGKDKYLMATFHHYSPWEFSGDNQGDYADKWTDDNIREPMDMMLEWSQTVGQGMPVYIGEWGVGWGSRYADMQCNNIRLWYTKFDKEFASPRGIPTMVWDDGGWFKVFDHQSNQYANNLIDCMTGKCEWTGSERFNQACN